MTDARQAPQAGPEEDCGRRWYHRHSTWWMALGWLVLLIVVAFPFPWWW